MDWWDSKRFKVSVAGKENQPDAVDITCIPLAVRFLTTSKRCWQVGRSKKSFRTRTHSRLLPSMCSLRGKLATALSMTGRMRTRPSLFSAQADRGQIGDRFGGFDCALIPIGYVRYQFLWQPTYDLTTILSRYLPHQVMSPVHRAPQDSVRLFRDIPANWSTG